FCDLVGSTELSARLDPEDFRDVVRAYQRSAEEAVGRFGGHVEKYLGDGLLVYFGWPTAHEDDAERAVRAGLALHGAISTLNERWQRAREGEGQVVLVTGEPGIGKSRLVQALSDELAAAPHTRIECQGLPLFQNTAFHSVEEMLRQGSAWRGDESAAERLQGLERALELAGMRLPEAVPLVAPLLNLPVPAQYPPLLASPEPQRRK